MENIHTFGYIMYKLYVNYGGRLIVLKRLTPNFNNG